jgi:DNA-binding transcriptional LysR family regulator
MEKHGTHRYKELHLGQLRAFCECVRQKSFAAAARSLGVSQPTVWLQVRALERQLGAALLRHHGRVWEPSEDGEIVLELASSIVGSVDSLNEIFQSRRREVLRTLAVITSPVVLGEELPDVVACFCREHPNISLRLIHYGVFEALDLLIDGEADVALLPAGYDLASNRRFLSAEPFAERQWSLILPEGHPLIRKRRIVPADLHRYPLIRPATGTVAGLDAFLSKAGRTSKMSVNLEVTLSLAARRLVGLGMGVGIYPQPVRDLKIPGIVIRPLGDLLPAEQLMALWRRGKTPRPEARLFVDFARAALKY